MTGFRPRTASEWLLVLWKRKLVFLLVAIVVFTAASLLVAGLPNVYESRTQLAVQFPERDRMAAASRVTAVTQELTSVPNLEAVAKAEQPFGPINSDADLRRSVAALSSGITLETKYRGLPESISLAYRDTDPRRAQRVVTALVGTFDRSNRDAAQKAADNAHEIGLEMADLNQQLLSLAERRSAATARGEEAERARSEQDLERAKREALAFSADELSDKRVLLERQISQQQDLIREQEKLVSDASKNGAGRESAAYGPLLARKAELQSKLSTYESQYTDKHPKVLETKAEVAEVDRQIGLLDDEASKNGATDSPAAAELRTLRRDLGRMQAELDVTKRALDRKTALAGGAPPLPAASVAAAPVIAASTPLADVEADVQYQTMQERYRLLLSQQADLSKAATAAELGLFLVTDPPSLPQGPVGPNRLKYEIVALAAALAAALALVAALELRRLPLVYDARDVEYFLGVPVIALIPETAPVERARPNRLLAAARTIGVLLLAVASVPALVGLFHVVRALAGR